MALCVPWTSDRAHAAISRCVSERNQCVMMPRGVPHRTQNIVDWVCSQRNYTDKYKQRTKHKASINAKYSIHNVKVSNTLHHLALASLHLGPKIKWKAVARCRSVHIANQQYLPYSSWLLNYFQCPLIASMPKVHFPKVDSMPPSTTVHFRKCY